MRHNPPSAGLQRGFTLIELMIVMVIVAVLATIAYPSFQESVRKSRRADAAAGLLRLQQLQERYRGNQPAYASAVASMATMGAISDSPERHYNLSIDAATNASYTMSATARSDSPQFADTRCRRMAVTMANGTIGTTSFDATNAEDTANNNRCWVR
jgi:type IV pilus assembly protein PilE